jgi:hypothetical protein
MKKLTAILAGVLIIVGMTACGNQGSTPEEMREIKQARDTCHELGGKFSQWYGGVSMRWECDFSDDASTH